MQYEGREESSNVEDQRGGGGYGGGFGGFGGGGGGPRMAMGGGVGTLVIFVVLMLLGVNPMRLLNPGGGQAPPGQGAPGRQGGPPPGQDEYADTVKLIKVVLKDTEDVWHAEYPKLGRGQYRDPKLVLFTQNVRSGCGLASANMGPFYCPADRKVYLDVQFFDELRDRFGAKGDFAVAYVVAHEIGHHVQNLAGISDQVHAARERLSEAEYNKLSVRLELQADFLAGVWAKRVDQTKKVLDPGDIEEAIEAARAVGDDRLQKQARGYVKPESFTHGTSKQRARWFNRGYETGDIKQMSDLFELEYNQL
ncbi:MAG: neutral zinc metallopeptidase [Planctomycetaceae bacterium]|nr:neutral zinc metallopeptidase [Planctomycetaceae bacterium]